MGVPGADPCRRLPFVVQAPEGLQGSGPESRCTAVARGFTAVKHQREVGTGYFDVVTQVIEGGHSSTTALKGSTENEQFFDKH